MKKIKAIIEKANDGGISIYSEDVNGAYGFGLTEQEAKEDFLSILEEQAEYYNDEHGEYPAWHRSGYNVEYVYDISGFFEAFPFINASKFAEVIGINGSVMRKYKGKIVTASERQKAIIQSRYNDILKRMEAVRF
ncbi:type II toxin-antitoxin system HicB family antitoxin [uncultured Parabacteroides sp.]|uniref:type II toxin-antitoxin system HicB family antitoxin n=1 Tax=uncultured Parabacteroides sp. TaxID=512312 RepID=UPI002804F175|nr:type II toxin-antitoxin system HicB family antitoxin [uncultured Parabacteroides sp.]